MESIAAGIMFVASDLPVHREVAGEAAVYFPRFSPENLAQRVRDVVNSSELARLMSQVGERRARDFSWEKHVDQMVGVARDLIERRAKRAE